MTLTQEAQAIARAYQPPDTGRPSDLANPELLAELLQSLADGNRRAVACQVAGIAEPTFYRWIKDGEAGQEPQASFVKAVKRAESLVEAKTVRNILAASEKPQFWAAGMTYLERKNPDHWGRRTDDGNAPKVIVQIGVTQSDVKVNIASLSPPNHQQLEP